MAIKIIGTEVISNLRAFNNLTLIDNSSYNDLYSNVVSIGTAIDFNNASMIKIMTGATTFTESNKSAGRVSFLLLDTSDSGFTPTFSANIEWPNDTEPTWSNARYWHIGLVCWDSTTVRAVASGYGSTGQGVVETVSLSGTSSSYNLTVSNTVNPTSAVAGWKFKTDGTLFETNIGGTYNVQFNAGTEWCNTTPSQTYYLRCTVINGILDGGSSATNTWLALTTERTYQVVDSTVSGSSNQVQLKIEIASDSGGSNILATGYYQAVAIMEP